MVAHLVASNQQPPKWVASLMCLVVPVSSGWLGGSDRVPGLAAASDHGGSDGDGELGVLAHWKCARRPLGVLAHWKC